MSTTINVAIADNSTLISKKIAYHSNIKVIYHLENENELLERITHTQPRLDMCFLNVAHRSIERSEQVIIQIKQKKPALKVVGFIPDDNEATVSRLLNVDTNGILLHNCKSPEIEVALHSLKKDNYYYPDFISTRFTHTHDEPVNLSTTEINFISFCCSELTYKEIADKMKTNTKTIDTMRDKLFKKLDVVSRTGLVLKGLKKRIITLE